MLNLSNDLIHSWTSNHFEGRLLTIDIEVANDTSPAGTWFENILRDRAVINFYSVQLSPEVMHSIQSNVATEIQIKKKTNIANLVVGFMYFWIASGLLLHT